MFIPGEREYFIIWGCGKNITKTANGNGFLNKCCYVLIMNGLFGLKGCCF